MKTSSIFLRPARKGKRGGCSVRTKYVHESGRWGGERKSYIPLSSAKKKGGRFPFSKASVFERGGRNPLGKGKKERRIEGLTLLKSG